VCSHPLGRLIKSYQPIPALLQLLQNQLQISCTSSHHGLFVTRSRVSAPNTPYSQLPINLLERFHSIFILRQDLTFIIWLLLSITAPGERSAQTYDRTYPSLWCVKLYTCKYAAPLTLGCDGGGVWWFVAAIQGSVAVNVDAHTFTDVCMTCTELTKSFACLCFEISKTGFRYLCRF
jgi:hypothetical protein